MSEEKWKCPKCGAENAADDNFCGECRTKKPVVGIGIAQTVKKQETVEKRAIIDKSALEKPKKKVAGKIVLILVAICVAATVCGVVINAQSKAKIAEQQSVEAEENGSLYWSSRSDQRMDWDEAVNYCKNLNEGGYNDWRLPNIDELRTLIKNCPETATGGQCKVSEKSGCLSSSCLPCYCDKRNNNGGYYSKLGDDDNVELWSSSVLSDDSNFRWLVYFGDGSVFANGYKANSINVRCVR